MTAEDRMSRAWIVLLVGIIVAAICTIAGIGWLGWQIASMLG